MLPAPISSRVGSPLYFRSCGARPIDAYGNTSVPSPIEVCPSITDDAPILQFWPMRTCGPTTANAPTVGARADDRGWRHASPAGSICAIGVQRQQQLGFDDGLAVDFGHGRGLARADRVMAPSVTIELQLIAGNDVLAELRAVDATQLDAHARSTAAGRVEQQQRRRLGQRLDHEDGRHQRLARKMTLEEFFVDGDVLERHQPLPRLVLGDGVDEERGKAVGEAFENVHLRGERTRGRRYGGHVWRPGAH